LVAKKASVEGIGPVKGCCGIWNDSVYDLEGGRDRLYPLALLVDWDVGDLFEHRQAVSRLWTMVRIRSFSG
jgi:hypothetical protein